MSSISVKPPIHPKKQPPPTTIQVNFNYTQSRSSLKLLSLQIGLKIKKTNMKIGDKGTVTVKVTKENCASAIGSGALDVFATPSMIALMENAACEAIKQSLQEGESSVGTQVNISHLKASPLNETITASAQLSNIEGRKLTFKVTAWDSNGTIGEGTHERFIINVEKFLSKLK